MLEHGGNLLQAAARFGRPVDEWIDLSTGLNPVAYPAPLIAASAWHRLPENDPALLDAARRYYGAPSLLAVAGTQAAIQALPMLRAPSRVVVSAPSYAEHAHHWNKHGHALREVGYEQLEAAVDSCDVMVVVNPNNPTGAIIAPARLRDWAARLASRGGWLVVDEAFADTQRDLSLASYSAQHGLIVLRSVGKFFGLAGVRVGFVAAHEDLLRPLADVLGPWTVSGPAQHITRTALEDMQWQQATATRLAVDGERLRAMLAAADIASTGTALFQWWPEARPEDFCTHMAERGIWVRLFRERARGIRIGLPATETAWRTLDHALNEWKTPL